uniref:Cellulase n=1 Tax=Leptinotarsa decemlineata TaxID=7539 RepID=E7CIY4_LEPDE|nr:endo-beta-1,4-glucanase [Leptinotarsa decemlineata]
MKLLVISLVLAAGYASPHDRSPDIIPIDGGVKGDGVTTRYWDCCAPSCAWDEIVHTKNGIPIQTCQKDGITPSRKEDNAQSGCVEGGQAYTCTNQSPYLVNETLAFGFSASSFNGGIDTAQCCMCVLLSFKDQLAGKQMLVQLTNTGSDLGQNHFDIAIPGGGVGIFTLGCSTQWGVPENGWGERYGGVTSIEECDELPDVLQEGCRFRFTFMEGVSNPAVSFYQVKCPAELIDISKCGDRD